jgi:hypothetical protein
MDPLVKITKVDEVSGINRETLAPDPQTRVTYMVGTHGPFTLVTSSKEFTPEYVTTETQKRVDALRALSVLV